MERPLKSFLIAPKQKIKDAISDIAIHAKEKFKDVKPEVETKIELGQSVYIFAFFLIFFLISKK